MRPTLTLQPLVQSHLGQVLKVYQQCQDFLALGPQPQASREMVLADWQHAQAEGSRFCGIFLGGELVGVADYLSAGFENQPQAGYVGLLMIAAPFRSAGLGREVVAELEAEMRRQGAGQSWVHVQVNNPLGLRFWERLGYRVYGPPALQPDGTTCVPLEKHLSD
jgi:ribosomal protein S18 acetylase RimI-like enzyme